MTRYEITIQLAPVHPRLTRIRGTNVYLSTIRFTWTLFTTLGGGKRLRTVCYRLRHSTIDDDSRRSADLKLKSFHRWIASHFGGFLLDLLGDVEGILGVGVFRDRGVRGELSVK